VKVVFHASAGPDLAGRLGRLPGLDVSVCAEDDSETLFRLLPACDVLWHVLQRCTAEMIAAAPRLRLIQKIGVGVNTVDLDAARQRGIPVCNLPGTNARAVAELTLGLMLSVLRRIPAFDRGLRAGVWTDAGLQDGIGELGGRTVGLIGFGAIPRILSPILAAMGCTVIYTARTPVADPIAQYRPLADLLAEADIISLHLPLVAETEHIIDAGALDRMKPGAILINTGRGGLLDQPALVTALRSGRLLGAGLDVFETEPLPAGDPLLKLPNVVVTPHIAWLTTGTFDRSFALAAENCRRIASGAPLLHRVA
jgi:phosphoglycerate dehydrogenase-like enzyme